MKDHNLLAVGAAIVGLLAPATASAEGTPVGGFRSPPPSPPSGGGHHVFPGFFWPYEREVVYVEREVIREVAAAPAAPPAPPPPPRKPYVIGQTYSSLPGGCMKVIDEGLSYYNCSGDWYRQSGSGSYKAVAKP